MARVALLSVFFHLLAWGEPPLVRAQPSVRIRAGSRIEMQTKQGDGTLRVKGSLTDDLGVPLPRRALQLRLAASPSDAAAPPAVRTETLRTDDAGRFDIGIEAPALPHAVRLRFAGDAHHEATQLTRRVDPSRRGVRLSLDLPEGHRVLLDDAPPTIGVTATSEGKGVADLQVTLLNEMGTPIAEAETDAQGQARLQPSKQTLGPAGTGAWIARSAANSRYDAAEARRTVLRVARPELTLRAAADAVGTQEPVHLEGALRTSDGPLAGMAVELRVDDRHVTTLRTDENGRFVRDVELDLSAGTESRLHARYRSSAPWLLDAVSAPLRIEIVAARGPGIWWLVFGALMSGALAWWLGRRRGPGGHGLDSVRPDAAQPAAGVQPAAPRRLGRATRLHVSGRLRDTRRGAPLSHACVQLEPMQAQAGSMCLIVSSGGEFASPRLAPGRWRVMARAEGFEPVSRSLTIPHHGEWADMQVWLESSRLAAERGYRPVALEVLRSQRLYELETPREILERAQSQRRAPRDLAALTSRVEQAFYGADPPPSKEVEGIREASRRVLEGLKTSTTPTTPRQAPEE